MLATIQSITFSSHLSKNIKIRINETTILPVVLYGCETWPLILREEYRMRVSENRVLRIFGPKRDELPGGWKKLHNEESHNLYFSPRIIRMIMTRWVKLAGYVAQMKRRKEITRKTKR
jgi:hypothetical protein